MFAFAAIDFETTGAVPGFPNEPWQVGVFAVRPGAGPATFESLLRIAPDRPFNRYAPGRHASLRAELAAAPAPAEVWPRLAPMLAGPVVAHNAAVERSVLAAAAPLHEPGPWIDTLALARAAWPDAPSHALEDLVPALGLRPALDALLPGRGPHDALYDAAACALLLRHLLSRPGWADLGPAELARIRPPRTRRKNFSNKTTPAKRINP